MAGFFKLCDVWWWDIFWCNMHSEALVHFYNLLVKAMHALCTSLLANVSKNLFSSKSLRNQIHVQNSFILSFRESVGGGGGGGFIRGVG
jgi:hypothetical protein